MRAKDPGDEPRSFRRRARRSTARRLGRETEVREDLVDDVGRGDQRDEAAACIACYIAALVYLNLRAPFYCVAKASYLVAATPCLAVLAAAGFDRLTRNPALRPAVYGAFACWAVSVYASFFVL